VSETKTTYYIIDRTDDFYKENYQEISFWIKFWFTLQQYSRPSNKSFRQFIEKIKMPFVRDSMYVLGKNVNIQISEKELVIEIK